MGKKVCSVCGKELDFWDEEQRFLIDHHVGYGSIYDEDHIKEQLCCDCLDKLIGFLHSERKRLNGR